MILNPLVDHYLADGCGRCKLGGTPACKVNTWREELILLRSILQDSGLTEEVKWSMPCYTVDGKNVLILAAFKEYCSLNFFKGSLMHDHSGMLEKAGENSQAGRLLKFTSAAQIIAAEKEIRAYVQDAIEVEKSGKKADPAQKQELVYTEELLDALEDDAAFRTAFESLTPGRRRAYHLFFSAPKQSQTRISRIEKCREKIMQGKGLND